MQKLAENSPKATIIDDCKNVCYDIVIDDNDEFIYICGMGYLKIYKVTNQEITLISEYKTSARSLIVYQDLMLLNKGMHGIELFKINEGRIEKLDQINVGFSVDLMRFNKVIETVIVSSKPIGKIGLIKVARDNKVKSSLSGLFTFRK